MNARHLLGNTHPSLYFPPLTNMTFHDLTTNHKLPPTAHHLLGLGLKFIPTPKLNTTPDALDATISRFERDLNLQVYFAGDIPSDYNPNELRVKSSWRAPLPPLNIDERIRAFSRAITTAFQQTHTIPNLSHHQQDLLRQIKHNKNVTILAADKGLGPVGVDTKQYIEWGLKHLTDTTTYTLLTEPYARTTADNLYKTIHNWTLQHHQEVGSDTIKYIRRHIETTRHDPFGYFYLLAKLHKTPTSTRPVCSDCASLPHALGKWVDHQLQPIVKTQTYYFKNSFDLKHLLDPMRLPPTACLFTYDAISMYTNIDTRQCLHRLTNFLSHPATHEKFPHLSPTPLVEALKIVMLNNHMRFGDLYIHQHKGIAMGMAPAPSIANLFVAIYEEAHVTSFPSTMLHFLKRFIDDGFGIWLRDPDPIQNNLNWTTFQTLINGMGLEWEFSPRSNEVNFMDLTITLSDGRLTTKLYAKPMALHLYIPPFSCHAPGISTGLIYGHFFRVMMLCSHQSDITRELTDFFHRLTTRGYSPSYLIPLFLSAEQKARTHQQSQHTLQTHPEQHPQLPARDNTFLHLQFHPANPPSTDIQRMWRLHVLTPPSKPPLYHLRNCDGSTINIKRLTIAYSRAQNLGNILSCRVLRARIGDYTDTPLLIQDESDHTNTTS